MGMYSISGSASSIHRNRNALMGIQEHPLCHRHNSISFRPLSYTFACGKVLFCAEFHSLCLPQKNKKTDWKESYSNTPQILLLDITRVIVIFHSSLSPSTPSRV